MMSSTQPLTARPSADAQRSSSSVRTRVRLAWHCERRRCSRMTWRWGKESLDAQLLEADAVAQLERQLGLLVGQQVGHVAVFVGEPGTVRMSTCAHKALLRLLKCDHLPRVGSGGLELRTPKKERKLAYVKVVLVVLAGMLIRWQHGGPA